MCGNALPAAAGHERRPAARNGALQLRPQPPSPPIPLLRLADENYALCRALANRTASNRTDSSTGRRRLTDAAAFKAAFVETAPGKASE